MIPRSLLLTAVLTVISLPLNAAVFHMADGQKVLGSYVGKAGDTVTILGEDGKKREIAASDILTVDWSHKLSNVLEKKAGRERKRFLEARRKAAGKLIRELARASEEDAQARIFEQLEGFEEPELIPVLDDALRHKKVHVRDYAFRSLSRFKSRGAIVPLVKMAVVARDDESSKRSHRSAVARDEDLARQLYEYVMMAGEVPERVRAIDGLTLIGDRQSVPKLIQLTTYVSADIRAQLVRTKRIREQPVSLGSLVGAAQDVTIDLPEAELIEVMTTIRVPVRQLRMLRDQAFSALAQITGEKIGPDPKAWEKWWASQAPRTPRD